MYWSTESPLRNHYLWKPICKKRCLPPIIYRCCQFIRMGLWRTRIAFGFFSVVSSTLNSIMFHPRDIFGAIHLLHHHLVDSSLVCVRMSAGARSTWWIWCESTIWHSENAIWMQYIEENLKATLKESLKTKNNAIKMLLRLRSFAFFLNLTCLGLISDLQTNQLWCNDVVDVGDSL